MFLEAALLKNNIIKIFTANLNSYYTEIIFNNAGGRF